MGGYVLVLICRTCPNLSAANRDGSLLSGIGRGNFIGYLRRTPEFLFFAAWVAVRTRRESGLGVDKKMALPIIADLPQSTKSL
jgi:hypothetical protein